MAALPRASMRKLHGTFVSLSITPRADAAHAQATCVVSKKVSASAVVRNTIKRRLRTAIAPRMKEAGGGTAFVFTAKREATDASFTDLKRDIDELFEKTMTHGTMRRT